MKKRRLAVLLVLVLTLPAFILLFCSCSTWSGEDFSAYDYFAVTDAEGKEYVYAPGETVFDNAVRAFATAKEGERPAWFADASPILLEWIRDEKAHRFRLYLMPARLAAYIEDVEGSGAYPTEQDIAFFLCASPLRTSLVGAPPPAVHLNGESIRFSVCSWTYEGVLAEEPFLVSSGDYLNQSAETYPLDLQDFSITFEQEPIASRCTVYCGEEEILTASAEELATSFGSLVSGEYQLVAVFEWAQERMKIRAGYSFSVSIP